MDESIKEKWKNEMLKISPIFHLFSIVGVFAASLFGIYAYFDLSKSANVSLSDFNKIAPGLVVAQEVHNSTVILKTRNGIKIERGKHTPNFQKLKTAAASKKITKVWVGEGLSIPEFIKRFLPEEVPPIYQVMAGSEILISYNDMILDHKDKIKTGHFLLTFPLVGIPFFVALIWGFKHRLES